MNPTDTSGGTTTGENHTTLLPLCEVPPRMIKNPAMIERKVFLVKEPDLNKVNN